MVIKEIIVCQYSIFNVPCLLFKEQEFALLKQKEDEEEQARRNINYVVDGETGGCKNIEHGA